MYFALGADGEYIRDAAVQDVLIIMYCTTSVSKLVSCLAWPMVSRAGVASIRFAAPVLRTFSCTLGHLE
jgi:hypothetical protein